MSADIFNIMDKLAKNQQAFLFILDFEMKNPLVFLKEEINSSEILFELNGKGNLPHTEKPGSHHLNFSKKPVSKKIFIEKFNRVRKELDQGNSYLLNLTFETEVNFNGSLRDICLLSKAMNKLWLNDRFVVFSPEPFIRIKNGTISTFPMKGTIDARTPDAERIILEDDKETAEHATIVDLLRNDLSRIAANVRVERYRYTDLIKTEKKSILQVSSEIKADLLSSYIRKPGSILREMLPAGSVTGAPKKKTVDLIREIEDHQRGYYTGIFGYFDGEILDSAVMIRFIEKRKGKYFYKSGGGITFLSDPDKEYLEYIDKIYVPIY